MAPGTWNAPGENGTVASAGGVAYCSRPKQALTCSSRAADPTDTPPVCGWEWGE